MQTRKRAKSVTFGKKSKDKAEKETVKKTVEEEATVEHKAAAETVEKTVASEKSEQDVLSPTPPKEEPEEPSEDVETPANEFVADSPLSTSPELPKDEKEKPAAASDEQPAISVSPENEELAAPIETPAQPAASATQQGQQPESEELSSTLPPSAFTIQTNQTNEQPAPAPENTESAVPEGGKKRFGLYFIVIAFLAFILGLGAMAAASYFGWVNGKLPSNVQLPVLGQKPTPTAPAQPTATPTSKPVDLTAFTISVLNGSGISGKAAEEKTALTAAGFKVTSTGNADNSNYTKTVIATKKSVDSAFVTKLEAELKKTYDVDPTVATSPDSSSTDVTVTLGQSSAK